MQSAVCLFTPTVSSVAVQSAAASVSHPAECAKVRIPNLGKRPEPLNVSNVLRASSLASRPASRPSRQIGLEEIYPQGEQTDLDVRQAPQILVDRPADSPIETRIQITDELGRGSFGTVSKGVVKATGEEVACKEIRRVEGCSVLSNCKIQKEVDIMATLKGCPAAVELKEYYQADETMYIITELLKGGDLESYLKTNGPLTEKQMALVANEALKLLSECHSKNIVHGDIKPANFVISSLVGHHLFKCGTSLMPSGWLKGIDFGTSQFTGKGRCSNKVGTPTHWAPEVFAESYHIEADMWSLGVMLYRLMCGRLPFWDEYEESKLKSERDVLLGVVYNKPDFSSEPWTNVSPECVDFIRGLLDPDYATRLTASSAYNHPFMARHLKRSQRFGLGMFEPVVLPDSMGVAMEAAYSY